jgi:hypothetical protein
VDGQEIGCVTALLDQREFLVEQCVELVGNAIIIAFERGLPDQVFEPFLRVPARGHGFVGIIVAQLVEREADAREQRRGLRHRFGIVAEQPRHFLRRLEMAFGIGFEQLARRLHAGALADAGDDVVQRALRRGRVKRVVGCEQGDARGAGDGGEFGEAAFVAARAGHRGAEP